MVEWIQENGDIMCGTKRYYVGKNKSTKCDDIKPTVEALHKASGGDWDMFVGCLSSNALKVGACRKILGGEVFAKHFTTTTKDTLELQAVDDKYLTSNPSPTGEPVSTDGPTDGAGSPPGDPGATGRSPENAGAGGAQAAPPPPKGKRVTKSSPAPDGAGSRVAAGVGDAAGAVPARSHEPSMGVMEAEGTGPISQIAYLQDCDVTYHTLMTRERTRLKIPNVQFVNMEPAMRGELVEAMKFAIADFTK